MAPDKTLRPLAQRKIKHLHTVEVRMRSFDASRLTSGQPGNSSQAPFISPVRYRLLCSSLEEDGVRMADSGGGPAARTVLQQCLQARLQVQPAGEQSEAEYVQVG